MKILESKRLLLRWLNSNDAAFILRLVNQPSWLQYIGDKGVKTLCDAEHYIQSGPVDMYDRLGFGMYLVELKRSGEPIGMCGLIKRESLDDVDIGFAFLPDYWDKGYAFESASAVMSHARNVLGFSKIVAITSQDNHASCKLLEKLGFRFERMVQLEANGETIKLYVAAPLTNN
ncbi:MAG: GNAT family N-acetyltransferase [Pseudomonadales bacterium]